MNNLSYEAPRVFEYGSVSRITGQSGSIEKEGTDVDLFTTILQDLGSECTIIDTEEPIADPVTVPCSTLES